MSRFDAALENARANPDVVVHEPGQNLSSRTDSVRANKYNNRRVEIDGHVFDSEKEARVYRQLSMLLALGEIADLRLHPEFELQPGFRDGQGTWHRAIAYQADFAYTLKDGSTIVRDVKGFKTKEFRIKEKMFRYRYPDITFMVG